MFFTNVLLFFFTDESWKILEMVAEVDNASQMAEIADDNGQVPKVLMKKEQNMTKCLDKARRLFMK